MRNISELDVSFNACLRFAALENITTDLQQSAIKILKVNYIHGSFEMSTVLKTSHILNLNKTSLVRFEAAGNRIQRIESGALQNFQVSLESADFNDNVFSIDIYMFDVLHMPITSLDVSQTFSSHNVLASYIEMCCQEHLDLSENMLDDINFKVSHMKKLMLFVLRNNRISTLSEYAMKKFDLLTNINANLTIDLSGYNLVCNCDTLSFVQWMATTPIHFYRRKKYKCQMSNNTIILLINPRDVYETLKKECMSYEGIIIGITSGILMFIFILCGGIVYRYRWKLRYLYYMVKVKWHDHEYQSDNTEVRLYVYDVIVSYADEDQTFVYNLLVHQLKKRMEFSCAFTSGTFTRK
ncbi:unnamed protein product [Mytilus coruscus]|uniref:LRRCT domain-containing protein n=1 Tax=Mytilus coruscus TaxID=42192 RepID=A0A6J8AUR9_MYTCO|nr:unnamed protein product [Mytilus coruscus]